MFSFRFYTAFLFLCGALCARAHDPGLSSAKLVARPGSLAATLTYAPADVAALGATERPEPARLQELAARSLDIAFDGNPAQPARVSVSVLDNHDVEFRLEFPAPAGARLRVGSPLLDSLPFGHRQYFVLADDHGAVLAEKLLSRAQPRVECGLPAAGPAAAPVAAASPPFAEFLAMGVKHILTGYDHLLFLFVLLLACPGLSAVARVITAFTLAHSLSLALATLGWVEIPSRIVEPLIAASIVYVALENLCRRDAPSHRTAVTFAFGLIHGFGFAGALREVGVGVNGGAVALPLFAFNTGVELGQAMVAAIVLPILWKLRAGAQRHPRWAPVGSILAALAGGVWFVQRAWGLPGN